MEWSFLFALWGLAEVNFFMSGFEAFVQQKWLQFIPKVMCSYLQFYN